MFRSFLGPPGQFINKMADEMWTRTREENFCYLFQESRLLSHLKSDQVKAELLIHVAESFRMPENKGLSRILTLYCQISGGCK